MSASDTLPKAVFLNGRERPAEVAMRRKELGIWRRFTWAEVAQSVRRIAAGLLALKLGDAPCIAIVGNNEPELFWAEYAIQACRRAAVCLYPDLTGPELAVQLEDCGARVVFAEDQEICDKLLQVADSLGLRAIVYWDPRGMEDYEDPRLIPLAAVMAAGDRTLADQPDAIDRLVDSGRAEDPAIVIYTSGTTGQAKGVTGSHRYLLDCAERWRSVLGATPGADYMSYISPAWGTEQYLGLALCARIAMVANFPEEPETVAADLREIGAEFLFFSPRQWEGIVSSTEAQIRDAGRLARWAYRWATGVLLAAAEPRPGWGTRLAKPLAELAIGRPLRDRLGFTHVRTAVNSGGALSPEVFNFFHALGVRLVNVYGFTEIGIVTATRGERRFDTVGRLLTSELGDRPLEVRIADNEIQVRGGVVFDGYYGRPDQTRARYTADGWVRSGDAGYVDDQGYLIYLDRLEDLRRLQDGQVFAPQFVETRMRLSPYIRDAIVVGDEQRSFIAALVDIDVETVGRWAEERRIAFTTHADLSQREEVYQLVRAELAQVNAGLMAPFRIRRFVNLYKPLDADEGELTRSRKLRRSVVAQKYAELIDGLYGNARHVDCSIEVQYQDGRTRTLTSSVQICAVEA